MVFTFVGGSDGVLVPWGMVGDGREQLGWRVRGCLVVGGFYESGWWLTEEKGRFVKGSCCGADGGAAGKEGKWKQRGWSWFFFFKWGRRLCLEKMPKIQKPKAGVSLIFFFREGGWLKDQMGLGLGFFVAS
jgi:hypothetical protein